MSTEAIRMALEEARAMADVVRSGCGGIKGLAAHADDLETAICAALADPQSQPEQAAQAQAGLDGKETVDPAEIEHPTNRYLFKQMLHRHNIILGEHIGDALKKLADPSQPEAGRVGLTDEQMWANNDLMELNAELGLRMDQLVRVVRWTERSHGIPAAKAEGER